MALRREDPRSTAALLEAATDWTLEDGWGDSSAVAALHYRGSREALEGALSLARSEDARARARAADILGQLGIPRRSYPEECLTGLLALADGEGDPEVLGSVASALHHLRDERGLPVLADLGRHPDDGVRLAVSMALGGREEPDAVAALLGLMDDPDPLVRDWATFGLGVQTDIDTPAVRAALLRRLADPDHDARIEAMRGLAKRGDRRVLFPLVAALRDDPGSTVLREAAADLLGEARGGAGDLVQTLQRMM